MKFVTSQNAILKALTLALGGTSKAIEHSIVRIFALQNLIKFETRNLEIQITSFLHSNPETEGEICVELVKLLEVIKKLNPLNDVLFEAKEGLLNIKNGRSKFSLKTLQIEEEIKIKHEIRASFKMMSKKFLSIIDKTKFSIYPDETRFNLNGLSLRFKEEENKCFLIAVSTDGHRLSISKTESSDAGYKNFPKIIVPKKSTLEIRKILENTEDEELSIELLDKKIQIISKTFIFISKLIDAEFPDYEKVIPAENTKIFEISRKDLINLAERVGAIYTQSTENGIKLNFTSNLLTASAKQKEAGEATDEININSNFEGTIEVNYNQNYFIEILNHISSDVVKIYLKDEKTPAIIKDEKLDSYFYILMPMRF